MSIRVAVIGAKGRMGSHAVDAINDAEGLELVAALGSSDSLETLIEQNIDVAVELTVPKSTEDNVTFLVENGIDTVVGTTGWDNDRLAQLEATLKNHPKTAVLIAPNFSIGAVLAMRFAELAAPTSTRPKSSRSTTPANSTPRPARRTTRPSASPPPAMPPDCPPFPTPPNLIRRVHAAPSSTESTSTPSVSRA